MNIGRATAKDFAELMDLMVRCFRTTRPDHPRFEQMYPDLYQPTDESMACNFIARLDKQIVACAGIFPIDVRIGKCEIKAAGVGGVCTAPEQRGVGYMTALMQAVREQIARDGCALSWLTGDRKRYARFGWEAAGSDVALRISRAEPRGDLSSWQIRTLNPDSGAIESLAGVRGRFDVRGVCAERDLRRKLRRIDTDVWEAQQGARYAYLVFNRRAKWILEWGGDAEGLRMLLYRCISVGGLWYVRLPPLHDAYTDIFFPMGDQFRPGMDNLAVFHLPELFRMYGPYLADAWPAGKTLRMEIVADNTALSDVTVRDGQVVESQGEPDVRLALDPLKAVSVLFGPVKPGVFLRLPEDKAWLDDVFPLPFHVPSLWRV